VSRKKTARTPRRASKRRAVSVLASESALGRRLARIEALLNVPTPSPEVSAVLILCNSTRPRLAEGQTTVLDTGHVLGTYPLGEFRRVEFIGPHGVGRAEAEAAHRQAIERLTAERPELLRPWPTPGAQPRRLTLHLGNPTDVIERAAHGPVRSTTNSLITQN
jgi:hypothetical protein